VRRGIADANLIRMTNVIAGPSAAAHETPRRGSAFLSALGRWALGAFGWRIVGEPPTEPKFVAIVAPHTSNWDFVVCVGTMFALDLKIRWLGKHQLFRWPLSAVLCRLGGWPVRRDVPGGLVAHAAQIIRSQPHFILAIAPEGTRSRVARWHTGFYRIAQAAEIPIVPVALDWERKEVIIQETMWPTGDMDGDIEHLMAGFRARMARYPAAYWEAAA
jgi:1-acyl-sn-glycerol-3-phosphate acyltransferase